MKPCTKMNLILATLLLGCQPEIERQTSDEMPGFAANQVIEQDVYIAGRRPFAAAPEDDSDLDTADTDEELKIPVGAEFSDLWGIEGELWNQGAC